MSERKSTSMIDMATGEITPYNRQGPGTLEDEHAPEREALRTFGDLPDPKGLSREWIVARLMKEATDHGTRTRQSARVTALKILAEVIGATDPDAMKGNQSPFAGLSKEQKVARIRMLVKKLNIDGVKVSEE